MTRAYSKRTAKQSKRYLSNRELLKSARDSTRAHAANQRKRDAVARADAENRRNQP